MNITIAFNETQARTLADLNQLNDGEVATLLGATRSVARNFIPQIIGASAVKQYILIPKPTATQIKRIA